MVEKLIQQTDVYLDINHDDKLSVVYDYVSRFEKPILTLTIPSRGNCLSAYAGIFSAERPEEMVATLKAYLDDKTHEN